MAKHWTDNSKKYWIVIKDFRKHGSVCKGYTSEEDEHFREILARCLGIAKPPLQVVRLGGPDCLDGYGEYAPYSFVEDQDLLNVCLTGVYEAEWLPLITEEDKQL